MRIAVINPFDPLPGDDLREARYAYFCRALAEAGHEVVWYSSTWSHALKKTRDVQKITEACRNAGFDVKLIPTIPYARNVGYARLRSHKKLAESIVAELSAAACAPEMVLVSSPPPCMCAAVTSWAKSKGVKTIVDVQDLWPETFERLWPTHLRWLNKFAFSRMARQQQEVYRIVDGVIGVSKGYNGHALPHMSPDAMKETLYLGVDYGQFDNDVCSLEDLGLSKPDKQKWIFMSGSLTTYLDYGAVVSMMEELQNRGRDDVRLKVVGYGPLGASLEESVRQRNLKNVDVMGRQPQEVFSTVAVNSDLGILPMHQKACVFFPNRVFQYFAAGIPIVSTIAGELEELLSEHKAGVTCRPCGKEMADSVEDVLASESCNKRNSPRLRPEWIMEFDRKTIARKLVAFVEKVASCENV